MLFLQYPLYRERLYWKISFGAEKIVRFMEYLLCDCPLYRDFSITVNLRSTCSKRHCRLIEVSALETFHCILSWSVGFPINLKNDRMSQAYFQKKRLEICYLEYIWNLLTEDQSRKVELFEVIHTVRSYPSLRLNTYWKVWCMKMPALDLFSGLANN